MTFGSLLTLILTIISLTVDLPDFMDIVSRTNLKEFKIECDRNKELGCSIDLSEDWKMQNIFNFWGDEDDLPYDLFQVSIIAGGAERTSSIINHKNLTDSFDEFTDEIYFPIIRDSILGYKQTGPFKARMINGTLGFYGKLFDIKTNELIGWFDGNEFGIVEACSFSWNKDKNGIEIIDKYGNVCFSMDLVDNGEYSSFNFLGYYKEDDTYIVHNCCLITKTKSLETALELIKRIEPKFDHYGTNSLGKRNDARTDKCWANTSKMWQ